jgi:hypothetical protein
MSPLVFKELQRIIIFSNLKHLIQSHFPYALYTDWQVGVYTKEKYSSYENIKLSRNFIISSIVKILPNPSLLKSSSYIPRYNLYRKVFDFIFSNLHTSAVLYISFSSKPYSFNNRLGNLNL